MEEKFKLLADYIPQKSFPIFINWIKKKPFQLKITRERVTKLGDYRAATNHLPHRISINHNLNKYAFLITLTHEFAHLLTWDKHQFKVNPHGKEWQDNFSKLIQHLLANNIFPNDVAVVLTQHIKKPSASSVKDEKLVKALNQYSPKKNIIHLSEIEEGTVFSLHKKRIFIKGTKRRTRYLCKDYHSKKEYLINGIAEVEVIDKSKLF